MGLIVQYGEKRFGFGLSAKFPLGACFDEIHKRALANLEMDEDHDLVFDYQNADPKISGKVKDDADLEVALLTAQRMNFNLILFAHKTTLAPTPEPTEPWGRNVFVKQVTGNVADGKDSGLPGPTANTQRKFTIRKQAAQTVLRLHYEDNFRVYNNGGVCYWELYLAGKRVKGTNKLIRGGMHSQGNDNNDHQTCSVIGVTGELASELYAAGNYVFQVQLSGNGRDCYTGWDPESKGFFMMEAKEVKRGEFGYIAWKAPYGPVLGQDNMFPITGRIVEFTKQNTPTALRLLYYDNFRVYNGGHCRWYLRVDRKICEGNQYIANSVHTHSQENDHVPGAFIGYCKGITAGKHKVEAGVQSGGHDCYTGWENSFLMEVREVSLETLPANFNKDKNIGSGIYMFHRAGNNVDGRDNGYINYRVLTFDKQKSKDETLLRIMYSDNLRVHGHGKWCKWELRVDEKPCAQNLQGTKYVVRSQNDHSSQLILGYCNGIEAGRHVLRVHVRGNSADCYTGWDRQSQGSFVLETMEIGVSSIQGGGDLKG